MLDIIAVLCLIGALSLLLILSIIDLKTYLLPNVLVAPFAVLAPVFHWSTGFYYLNIQQILLGGIVGFLVLYGIRAAGNKYYGQDSLGLGDVKLLGAAGLWLGLEGGLFAMSVGAFAGLLHGIGYALIKKIKTGQPLSLARLTIPAGPGFAVGIILIGSWMFKGFISELFYDLFG